MDDSAMHQRILYNLPAVRGYVIKVPLFVGLIPGVFHSHRIFDSYAPELGPDEPFNPVLVLLFHPGPGVRVPPASGDILVKGMQLAGID